jgi:hypothetical protein
MKADEAPDGTLVVSYDGSALTKVLLAVAAMFLGLAGYDTLLGTRGTDRVFGLVASAGGLAGAGLMFLEWTRFEFAPATRTVTWQRRWALRRRQGALAFGDIGAVLAERPIGDDGTPSRRIVLKATGGDVPITVGYQADPDGEVVAIADRIRGLLGQRVDPPVDDVRQLAEAGRLIDAIRVLREREGLSLTEAKQRLEELTRRA